MIRKYKIVLLLLVMILLLNYKTVNASGDSDEEPDAYDIDELYEMYNFEEVDRQLNARGISDFSFEEITRLIADGNTSGLTDKFFSGIWALLTREIASNKGLMIQLIVIALIGAVFVNLSNSFGSGFISENGFYITYIIMTSIILTSFSITMDMIVDTLEGLLELLGIITPIYAMSMCYTGYSVTGSGIYQIVLAGIWIVQFIVIKIIIPMIKFYVIISLINNLNKDESFSKLCSLIKKIVEWLLKSILVFAAGLNITKALISPQVDALGRNAVTRAVNAIPGGSMISVITGTFLGAGLVIKNSIGLTGIILLLLFCITPMIKAFLVMLIVRITTVIIQPLGEKRYVNGVESLAAGITMLLQAISTSMSLFLLTIAIVAFSTNGG